MKDFFRKCDQILRKLCIWSHLLKKSLMENLVATKCIITHDDHLTISSKYQVMDLISRQFTFKYPDSEARSEPS